MDDFYKALFKIEDFIKNYLQKQNTKFNIV